MKIKRLELKAFGPFSGEVLDFSSPVPGLHIVYGANEAGKSSAMRALHAWFFGFPVRTGDNFIHQNQQLLVGGCLERSGGEELAFFRRKRNLKDLFDLQDQALEPSLLPSWLHGLDKELFTALYGISHETLVLGGQGILDQQGEVGKALFAAGAGIASLKPLMDELATDGERLFRPKGSNQMLNEALVRHRALQDQLKQATLPGREWEEHRKALDEGLKKLDGMLQRKQVCETEKRRLERLMQALPDLADRKNLLERLADAGEVTLLPADFTERRAALEEAERAARLQHEQLHARIASLQNNIAAHSFNKGVLDEAPVIEELHQRLGEYRKGKSDLPVREGQRIHARTTAAEQLRQIRPGLSLGDVEILRPALAKKKRVQDLASRYEAIVLAGRTARLQVQESTKTLEQVRDERQQQPPVQQTDKLAQALFAAERGAGLDREIAVLEQEHKKSDRECRMLLNRLVLWKGSPEEVLHLSLPLQETVNRFDDEFRLLLDQQRQLLAETEALEKDLAEVTDQLSRLESIADVPSVEELFISRARRNEGWQLLRRQWLLQEDVAGESRTYDPAHPLPEAYERMVAVTDSMADRLYREADRVRHHLSLKMDAEKLERRLALLRDREQQRSEAFLVLNRQWQEQWADCGVVPLSPREMSGWLVSFDHLRLQVREVEKKGVELAEKIAARKALRGNLLQELSVIGGEPVVVGEELAPLLDYARLLLDTMHTREQRCESLDTRIRDLFHAVETAGHHLSVAEDELRQWRSEWHEVTAPFGFDASLLPAEVFDSLENLQACFERLKEADEFRKRIEGIERDIKAFEEDVERLVLRIAPDLAGGDVHAAVTELRNRLGHASREQAIAQRELEELERFEKEIMITGAALQSCEEQLAAMCRHAHCCTREELLQAEQRSLHYSTLRSRLLDVETHLARIAENTPFAVLEEQAQLLNADELPGIIDALHQEIVHQLDPAIQQLSESIGRKRNELERMDGSGKAAELADALQLSLTKIRRLTERYIRVRLAEKMLREETERYRSTHEAPVLTIASRYFAELTLGAYARLDTDTDDHGQLVLTGIRPDGIRLPVEAMSSGTRDQLYLALRLATLEWRMMSSEPMPLIADDILINFDDARSRATIAALARLAEKSQVILFTHHRKIIEVAGEDEFAGRVFVHQLRPG